VRESSWWPTLVAVVDHAIARGTPVEDLLDQPTRRQRGPRPLPGPGVAPVHPHRSTTHRRRTGHLAGPRRLTTTSPTPSGTTSTRRTGHPPSKSGRTCARGPTSRRADPQHGEADLDVATDATDWTESSDDVYAPLAWAARAREFAGILPPTDREIDTQLTRAYDADTAPVSPDRILELNRIALDFYTSASPGRGLRPTSPNG
jgi:hypothetical protein